MPGTHISGFAVAPKDLGAVRGFDSVPVTAVLVLAGSTNVPVGFEAVIEALRAGRSDMGAAVRCVDDNFDDHGSAAEASPTSSGRSNWTRALWTGVRSRPAR